MTKVKKLGNPFSIRLPKQTKKDLEAYCIQHEINKSDVVQAAVACFLSHAECVARKEKMSSRS